MKENKQLAYWHIKQDIKHAQRVPDQQTPFNSDLAFKFSLVLMYEPLTCSHVIFGMLRH